LLHQMSESARERAAQLDWAACKARTVAAVCEAIGSK
jgi:hypothetical protein